MRDTVENGYTVRVCVSMIILLLRAGGMKVRRYIVFGRGVKKVCNYIAKELFIFFLVGAEKMF